MESTTEVVVIHLDVDGFALICFPLSQHNIKSGIVLVEIKAE